MEGGHWQVSVLALAVLLLLSAGGVWATLEGESYDEEVVFTPIGKSLVLSQFVFRTSSSKATDHVLFPWGMHQLQRSVPFKQFNLALTKGRWDFNAWGAPPPNVATPAGLELFAAFPGDLSLSTTRALWGNLSEALSGMVCASLAGPAAPTLLHPKLHQAVNPHGTLPQGSAEVNTVQDPLVKAVKHASINTVNDPSVDTVNNPSTNTGKDPSVGTIHSSSINKLKDATAGTPSVQLASGHGSGSLDEGGNGAFHWLHLLLPQEEVCTENLTPLLKLLPCRGVAGVAALLPIPVLHAAHFYSLQLITSAPDGPSPTSSFSRSRHLTIMVNIVHTAAISNPTVESASGSPPAAGQMLHLSSLFPLVTFPGSCALASSSSVYVVLPSEAAKQQSVLQGPNAAGRNKSNGEVSPASTSSPHGADVHKQVSTHVPARPEMFSLPPRYKDTCQGDSARQSGSGASPAAPTAGHASSHSQFSAMRYSWKQVAAAGKLPDVWVDQETLRHAARSQVLTAWKPQMHAVITGPIHGQLMLRLSRHKRACGLQDAADADSEVCLVQVIPNHMRVWLHSSQLLLNGRVAPLKAHLTLLHLTPPLQSADSFGLQLCLSLPATTHTSTLSWRFSRAIKHVFDHPPDAARGLDIAPVMVVTKEAVMRDLQGPDLNRPSPSAVMWDLLTSSPWKVYSETLVTPIPTPDFSMPYNVCCLTCTLLAVFFGTTLNTLMIRGVDTNKAGANRARRSVRSRVLKMAVAMVLMMGLLYKFDEATREAVDGALQVLGLEPKAL